MLVGHVSDENYLALTDVAVELRDQDGGCVATHSTASGAIHAAVGPGRYRITLARTGFGSKHVDVALPGTHRFRLLSDQLYGYAWPKWVRAGDTGELRVHSTESYRAELFRYDVGKEFSRLLGWFDEHGPRAMAQLLPDDDVTQVGTRWNRIGFTSPAHTPRLVAPNHSGLYYVHVTTESGRFVAFPWVVAPAAPRAPIAVLASTNTWNAYNNFGGRSNYINVAGIPPEPTINARLDLRRYVRGNMATQDAPNEAYPPLSFDRPEPCCHVDRRTQVTDPATGRLASSLAPGLWRLLAWLTGHGHEYDLYADAQLHSGELDLDSYRVLVLDGHPEYWSRAMYERVKRWVFDRGGRLIYLGGNGIDCEVEFTGMDAAIYRTQQPDPDDPAQADLESRFHRTVEPQSRLLGVAFTSSGEGTAAPYEVRAPDHWIFTGTGLGQGERFGAESLHERVPGGASGHETDKRTRHAPAESTLLAKGTNPENGGAEMVLSRTSSGGAVFSAGSMTYIAGLLVDSALSTITENVFTRFLDTGPVD